MGLQSLELINYTEGVKQRHLVLVGKRERAPCLQMLGCLHYRALGTQLHTELKSQLLECDLNEFDECSRAYLVTT